MTRPVHVVGVGMIPFAKPGASKPYPEMAAHALRAALADARLGFEMVEPVSYTHLTLPTNREV